MLENFQGNVYFAGRRMTVDKCIILDYYVAVLLQFLNVHFPMGSLAQWGTRGLSCLSLRFESHASLVLFSTSFNFFFLFLFNFSYNYRYICGLLAPFSFFIFFLCIKFDSMAKPCWSDFASISYKLDCINGYSC